MVLRKELIQTARQSVGLRQLLLGQCQAVTLSLHNTPFGDIVDAEDDIQPAVRSAFEYTSRVLDLLTQVLKSVTIDVDRALSICQSGEITLTEWLTGSSEPSLAL